MDVDGKTPGKIHLNYVKFKIKIMAKLAKRR
jgi:hypothetical protein